MCTGGSRKPACYYQKPFGAGWLPIRPAQCAISLLCLLLMLQSILLVYFRSFQGVTIEEAGQHSGVPFLGNIATGTIRRRYICVRETIQPGQHYIIVLRSCLSTRHSRCSITKHIQRPHAIVPFRQNIGLLVRNSFTATGDFIRCDKVNFLGISMHRRSNERFSCLAMEHKLRMTSPGVHFALFSTVQCSMCNVVCTLATFSCNF